MRPKTWTRPSVNHTNSRISFVRSTSSRRSWWMWQTATLFERIWSWSIAARSLGVAYNWSCVPPQLTNTERLAASAQVFRSSAEGKKWNTCQNNGGRQHRTTPASQILEALTPTVTSVVVVRYCSYSYKNGLGDHCSLLTPLLNGSRSSCVLLLTHTSVQWSLFCLLLNVFCYANQSCCAFFIRPDRFNTARTGSLGLDWSKKVARSRLPSVGFRSWSRFLAVNLQMMRVINPAVGCHYFPPGPQYQFRCLVNRGTMGVNSLPKTVTRQRRGYALNPDPSAP